MKQIKSYMKAVNINLYNIEHIQNNEIKKRVQDIDNSMWKADLIEKSTLTLYRRYTFFTRDSVCVKESKKEVTGNGTDIHHSNGY